jgi:hypothetical protein
MEKLLGQSIEWRSEAEEVRRGDPADDLPF